MDISKLKIEQVIGVGGFARVRMARVDDKKYAIKIINKKKQQRHNIKREVIAGMHLKHENISNYVQWYEDDVNDFLVFDYVEGVDLLTYLNDYTPDKRMTEDAAKITFRQLVMATEYMHINNVVHLDLKLDNVIVEPTTLKATIIDFGLCDFVTEQNKGWFDRRVGSESYAPPEMLKAEKSEGDVKYNGEKVDIWLLGMVLFAMLTGKMPFSEKRATEFIRGKKHPEIRINHCDISNDAKSLLRGLLALDPKGRMNTNEIMRHTWLS